MTFYNSKTTSPQANLKLLVKHFSKSQWKEELEYIESEVVFYRKLLRMAITNGSAQSRPLLHSLLEKILTYENYIIPAIHQSFNELTSEGKNEKSSSLNGKLFNLRIQLKEVKTQFFPLISELQIITLW